MARKIKKLKPLQQSAEIGPADAVTVGWMLAVTTTLVCELAVLAAYWYAAAHPQAKADVLCGLLLVAAIVIGLVSLCLLPLVVKLRRQMPPLPVVIFAIIVSLSPLATAMLLR